MKNFVCIGVMLSVSGCVAGGDGTLGNATQAIIGGTTDTGDPAVVYIEHDSAHGASDCTGELVSPTVVLTAAHCVMKHEGDTQLVSTSGANFWVYPGYDVTQSQDPDWFEVAEVHADPLYNGEIDPALDAHDVGVLVLAQPVTTITPLPVFTSAPTSLVGMNSRIVGYGVTTGSSNGPGDGTRRQVPGAITGVQPGVILAGDATHQNCYGDSGGPVLVTIGGQEMIVAVTSAGNDDCTQGWYSRLDVSASFLAPYLPPPTTSLVPDAGGIVADMGEIVSASADLAEPSDPSSGTGSTSTPATTTAPQHGCNASGRGDAGALPLLFCAAAVLFLARRSSRMLA